MLRDQLKGWRRIKALLEQDYILGYFLIFPVILVVFGLIIYPFFSAIIISLQDKIVGMQPRFIGLKNYYDLLMRDSYFRRTAINSFVFTLTSVSGKLILGMIMALILNQKMRLRNIYRGVLLLPWVIPTVVTCLTWRWIFDDMHGILNHLFIKLGIIERKIAWLGTVETAMGAVVATNIWRGFPFFGVTLLAGLQTIPLELYEAAEVDGASPWQKFRYITLPGIKVVALITTLLSTIWTFNDFQIVYILTRGGPSYTTQLFATYTYEIGIVAMRLGMGVAVSIILVPVLISLILILTRYLAKEEGE